MSLASVDRLVERVDRRHDDERQEELLLEELVVERQPVDHGRRDEGAVGEVAVGAAACRRSRIVPPSRGGHRLLVARHRPLVDHRADVDVALGRVADLQLAASARVSRSMKSS